MTQPIHRAPAWRSLDWRWLTLLALVALGLVSVFTWRGVGSAPAANSNLDAETLRIAKNLYCPVCPSTPLEVCDTQACVQWRALIREKLAAGQNEEQIRQYFVTQYGERVLGAPPVEGFNIGAYVFPFILLLLGAGFLFVTMQRWQRTRAVAKPSHSPPPIAPEYAERIARALKEHE